VVRVPANSKTMPGLLADASHKQPTIWKLRKRSSVACRDSRVLVPAFFPVRPFFRPVKHVLSGR